MALINQSINTLLGGGGTGGNVTLGSGTLSITQGTSGTYAGVISGAGNVTLAGGAGTLTLSGTNTYTGNTNLNGSTLLISSDANLGAAPGSATLNKLNFNGGTLEATGTFALNANRGVAFNASNNTIQVDPTFTLTYNGLIVGSGGLTKTGTGTLILGGANTYSGATNINAGTIRAGAANVLSSTSSVTLANTSGVTFDMNSFKQTINNLSGGGSSGGNITLGSSALSVTQNSAGTFAGVISGTGGLTKSGAAQLTLSNANTYSGATSVNNGTLSLSNASATNNSSGITTAAGTTLDLAFSNATFGNSNIITSSGNLSLTGSSITLSNPITLNADMSITGGGTGTMNFNGTISGAYNLTAALNQNSTNLAFSGLNVGGTATITSRNITGSVAVGGLALKTNFADLNGTVNGASGSGAVGQVKLLNVVYEGTHFINGFDMSHVPSPQVVIDSNGTLLQSVYGSLYVEDEVIMSADEFGKEHYTNFVTDYFNATNEEESEVLIISAN